MNEERENKGCGPYAQILMFKKEQKQQRNKYGSRVLFDGKK